MTARVFEDEDVAGRNMMRSREGKVELFHHQLRFAKSSDRERYENADSEAETSISAAPNAH